jgi:hypothetical protein
MSLTDTLARSAAIWMGSHGSGSDGASPPDHGLAPVGTKGRRPPGSPLVGASHD